MKKIIFIADIFYEQLRSIQAARKKVAGGGEMVNEVIINHLRSLGYDVEEMNSQFVTPEIIRSTDAFFIVGNFIGLDKLSKQQLQATDYIIIEHDHKYLRTRDPSPWEENDYIAPPDQVVNKSFYESARAVFCQSQLHSQILSDNLMISNVVNFGCSLWSDEQMAAIKKHANKDKTKSFGILESTNEIKGNLQSKHICETRGFEYEMIPSCEFEELMEAMSEFETIMTMPQVIETFCRVVVEARMLGCKIATNKRNGCASEPWFAKLKGQDLINFVESQREVVLGLVVKGIEDTLESPDMFSTEHTTKGPSDITVILNAYRRPYNLSMQIKAIRNQTRPPKEIWLWVNDHEDNRDFDFEGLDVDRVFLNDHNWKFFGRFAAALLADTEYVAIYDDDTVPGTEWHENCLDTMKTSPGILGSAGVTLNDKFYVQHTRCGWPTQNLHTTRVDLVGHAWFFKREWLSHLWREKPATWDNGEDIHFSYCAQKYGGIQTYCPPHPPTLRELHGSVLGNELGIDDKATSTNSAVSHQRFFSERDMVVQNAIAGGWETVNGIKL